MSDFDKILRDKLNEEDDFPRMQQNWQKLSARMVAESPPPNPTLSPPSPWLYAWKWAVAATTLLLVTSNIWWWFHDDHTQHIGKEVAVSAPKAKDTIIQTQIVQRTDTVYKTIYVTPNSRQQQGIAQKEADAKATFPHIQEKGTPSVFEQKLVDSRTTSDKNAPVPSAKINKDKQDEIVTKFDKNAPATDGQINAPKTPLTTNMPSNAVKQEDKNNIVEMPNPTTIETPQAQLKNKTAKNDPLVTTENPIQESSKPANFDKKTDNLNNSVEKTSENSNKTTNKHNTQPIKQDTAAEKTVTIVEVPKAAKPDATKAIEGNKRLKILL